MKIMIRFNTMQVWRQIRYGLPVFRVEWRIKAHEDDKVKEILRDKRTHMLATCMALYPTTPTNELAKEFGISRQTIKALASMYDIHKDKGLRSRINRENAKQRHGYAWNEKTIEQVTEAGEVVATYRSAYEAAGALGVSREAIYKRTTGKIEKPLKGYYFRHKEP